MAIPEKFGRYEIKSELGRGGMATVYRGYDPISGREVAIKVLPREMLHDPQFRSRFEREVKMIASLEHPSIVPVYDVGDEDGQPYFVMRYMPGGSLSNWIERGPIPIQETARIIEKVAQGLSYAHRKGIIHRDLKPDNVLFDDNGDPFISDFGVAKLTESTSSLTGSGVIGTPAYMSPEQAQGVEIDLRSDVYGLGVIVYQMLTGQQPYNADTPMGVVVQHITEPVPEILKTLPSLPAAVDQIIKTAMAKDKEKRFPNTIELAKTLNLVAFGSEGNITFNTNSGTMKRAESPSAKLSRGQTGFAVIGIVLLVAVIGFFLLRNQLTPPPEPTVVPTATETPTQIPPTFTEEPTVPVFAPMCPAEVSFPTPEVDITENKCVQKIPYAFVQIEQGSAHKVLNSDVAKCTVENTVGRFVLSCTGPDFTIVQLQVCKEPELSSADLTQCDAGSTFNTENQCCVATPPEEAGCRIIEIQLKGCG